MARQQEPGPTAPEGPWSEGGAERTARTEPRTGATTPRARRHDLVAAERQQFGGMKLGAAFFGWLAATGMAVLLSAATAAADPAEEPPGVWLSRRGLRVPVGFMKANSVVVVLPASRPPARSAIRTTAASQDSSQARFSWRRTTIIRGLNQCRPVTATANHL